MGLQNSALGVGKSQGGCHRDCPADPGGCLRERLESDSVSAARVGKEVQHPGLLGGVFFFFFLAMPHGLRDFSSITRD